MKILIVEDDTLLLQGLILAAQTEGYACDGVTTARMAEQSLEAGHYSLVVLDLGLPDEDGLHFLARIRQKKYTLPVLILTARDTLTDKIAGLDVGADDYLVKPFGVMELMSRVKAIMRRINPTVEDNILQYKNVVLDLERRLCQVDDNNIELTFKEYELLRMFMVNTGIVLTRDMIMEKVWDYEFAGESRTVDMHIKTLRKKLGEAGSLIVTVRNVGYKLQ